MDPIIEVHASQACIFLVSMTNDDGWTDRSVLLLLQFLACMNFAVTYATLRPSPAVQPLAAPLLLSSSLLFLRLLLLSIRNEDTVCTITGRGFKERGILSERAASTPERTKEICRYRDEAYWHGQTRSSVSLLGPPFPMGFERVCYNCGVAYGREASAPSWLRN
ncbi:hypothetical protein F4809DRAFT_585581 [Biscogniauxia mediterranea]|nr:hypothetical protein F4809DRAFT_585581 [Biscogniauxia mediterranea]